MKQAGVDIALRPITRSDLRQVRSIERTAYADAWPRTAFAQELRNGSAHYIVAVALPPESDGEADATRPPRDALSPLRWLLGVGGTRDRVVGYAGVWFTADQLHLVTIAVAPEFQGGGVAQRMLLECFELALRSGLHTIALEVRPSNERAIRLYEIYGFRRAGRLAGYYTDNGEDAIVMVTPELDKRGFRQHIQQLQLRSQRWQNRPHSAP